MAAQNTCLKCGAPLAGDTRPGFCPKCLFLEAGAGMFGPEAEPDAEDQEAEGGGQRAMDGGQRSVVSGQSSVVSSQRSEDGGQRTAAPSPLAPRPSPLLESFGDYELIEEIGRGGMGVVYRARQRSLDRVVAIKMMAFGPGSSPELVKRFRAEAVSAASLHHPNIVAIHEVGIHEGQHFFVMDYVEGQSLARLVGSQPLPAQRAAAYLEIVAEAVHYAHERGILHRDLKPSNVLIDAQDQPHVVDFGLARRLEGDSELTVTGQVLGSPHYLPPEQASGQRARVSRRTDVYALGATLYHLLTGRPPFQAESLAQTLDLVLHSEPLAPRLLNPGVPRDLETICLKCLEKEPSRRYATARELADELARFQAGEPIQARPLGAVGKTWRWCRRNPRLASALGVALLSLLIGLVGVTGQWRRAESQRARAEAGELLARRNAYAADMKEVQRALDDSDLGRARALLGRHRPEQSPIAHRPSPIDLRSWEWRYLWARCQSEERFTLHQYSNAVSAVAFSSDGKWLAVLRESSVAVWDAVAQRQIAKLPAYGGPKAVAFSPRGNLLAWGREDTNGTPGVSLRDVSTQQDMASLPHSDRVVSLAFAPDVKAMATLAYDGTVRVWDLESALVVTQFVTAPVDVGPDRFSARPRMTVISAADATRGLRELESQPGPTYFTSSVQFTDHYGCVLFSPDGRWLAIGEARPEIRLRDRITGSETNIPVPAPADGITALAFSPDSRLLAAGCGAADHNIHVWDLAGGTEVRLVGHSGWVAALAFSPDGETLASASSDQTVRLWDLNRHAETNRLQGNLDEVWALAWSADGTNLVTGARDGSVRYWDPAGRPAAPYQVLPEPIHWWGLAFFPDSQAFLTTTRPGGAVVRWDAASVQVVDRLSFLGTSHTSLDLSPDGCWLALSDAAGNVQVWDFPGRRMVTNLIFPDAKIFGLWFSPRGNLLAGAAFASGGRNTGKLFVGKLWAVAAWNEVNLPAGTGSNVFDGNFSPDERTVAIGYGDGTAAWWDLATRERTAFFDCHSAHPVHAVFSPDGRHFATGSLDGLMALWDMETKKARPIVRGHRNALHDLLFSPDSRRLLASGTSPKDVIKLWDVETGRDVATLPGEPGWYVHMGFSPDGNTLFAASMEGTALLWRAPSFEEIEAKEKKVRAQ